jgi:hypothetical protein
MELDDLKTTWAQQSERFDVKLQMNELRWPMRRFAVLAGAGAAFGLLVLNWLGSFVYQHWTEPRFAFPGAVLQVWVVAMLAASVRQVWMAARMDYSQPVTAIQRQIEELRIFRIRVTKWGVLTGQLVWWIPFVIVAFRGILDVDIYRYLSTAYLVTNIGLGLAAIPVAVWISRRYSGRTWLTRELSGYNLNRAAAFVASISEFEAN